MQGVDALSDSSSPERKPPSNSSPADSANLTKATTGANSALYTTYELSDTSFFSQHKPESPEVFEARRSDAPLKAQQGVFAYQWAEQEQPHPFVRVAQGLPVLENDELPRFGQQPWCPKLTKAEQDIADKIADLSFDQAGCRMI